MYLELGENFGDPLYGGVQVQVLCHGLLRSRTVSTRRQMTLHLEIFLITLTGTQGSHCVFVRLFRLPLPLSISRHAYQSINSSHRADLLFQIFSPSGWSYEDIFSHARITTISPSPISKALFAKTNKGKRRSEK